MKKINKKKYIKLIIALCVIVMLVAMGTLYERNDTIKNFFDKYVFMKKVSEEKITCIQTEATNIIAYQSNILVLKDNNLVAYNKFGKEEYTIDVELTNPIYSCSDKYLCIAEKQGKRIYVISGRNIVWQNSLEGQIEDVNINESGYLAVTISGTTDKSVVEVYDNKGNSLFSKHIAEDYVIDTDISKDNSYLAIAKVNYSGIEIQSTVEIISITQAEKGNYDIAEYKANLGELLINIKYHTKNLLVCVYDNHVEVVNGSEVKKIDEFTENTMFADVNNKIVEIIKEKSGILTSNINIKIINSDVGTERIYKTEEPKQIYVYGDIIAINLGSEAIFINNNGWLLKEYKSSQEINKIVISSDIAGIVYKDKIGIISL